MKFLFHIVANKQCGNAKLYIRYTHLHVTTVGKADYFHCDFFLTDIKWEFCDVSNTVLHPGVFSSMALESSHLQNIAYQFVLNSNTGSLWICFVVAAVCWHYEVCDCFWRILSRGSYQSLFMTCLRLPVHSCVIVVAAVYHSDESFLVFTVLYFEPTVVR